MKLASLADGTRDGALCVVSRNLRIATIAYDVAPTLQAALDDWDFVAPRLGALYEEANREPTGSRWFELEADQLMAPLPRVYSSIRANSDGAGQPQLERGPALVGGPLVELDLGTRRYAASAELAVLTDDVPAGVDESQAGMHIRLLLLTLCCMPLEAEQSAVATAFDRQLHIAAAPIALTPDELGAAWDGYRLQLPLQWQQEGHPAADMLVPESLPALLAAAARHRPLPAGTLLRATAIFQDTAVDANEKAKTLISPAPLTAEKPLQLSMQDATGRDLFGAIQQGGPETAEDTADDEAEMPA